MKGENMKVKVISLPYFISNDYIGMAFFAKVLTKQGNLDIPDEILCYFYSFSRDSLQVIQCATLLSLVKEREEEVEIEGITEPGNRFCLKKILVHGYTFSFDLD
jgi:hypothetical protein